MTGNDRFDDSHHRPPRYYVQQQPDSDSQNSDFVVSSIPLEDCSSWTTSQDNLFPPEHTEHGFAMCSENSGAAPGGMGEVPSLDPTAYAGPEPPFPQHYLDPASSTILSADDGIHGGDMASTGDYWASDQNQNWDASMNPTYLNSEPAFPYDSSNMAFRQGFDHVFSGGMCIGQRFDAVTACDPSGGPQPHPCMSLAGTTDSWSALNPRNHNRRLGLQDLEYKTVLDHLHGQRQTSTLPFVNGSGSSVPATDPATSQISFNEEVDEDMINGMQTLRSFDNAIDHQALPQHMGSDAYTEAQGPANPMAAAHTVEPIRWQYRVTRVDTPDREPADKVQFEDVGPVVYIEHQQQRLDVPFPEANGSGESSLASTPSEVSFASSSVPTVLHCDKCNVSFSGDYRRGNRARHIRETHRKSPGAYPCQDPRCHRSFNRSDARLKHYRKHHEDLARPLEPRPHRGRGRGGLGQGRGRGRGLG